MSIALRPYIQYKYLAEQKKRIYIKWFMVFFISLCISFSVNVRFAQSATDLSNPQTALGISSLIQNPHAPIRLQLDFLVDPELPVPPLNPESVLFPSNAKAFKPYSALHIIRNARAIWFRARIAPYSKELVSPLVIDLQSLFANQFAGTPNVWVLPNNDPTALIPKPIKPNLTGFYPLPSAHEGMVVFIQLANPPSIAFAPIIRTEASLTRLDRYGQAVILISLAFLLFIALIRGVFERREWRIWSTLYIASLFTITLWGSPKVLHGLINLWDLPALLAPGFALLILPHIGRHMMRTRDFAPILDTYLILCTILGFTCVMIPLIPEQTWTLTLLSLWPLCTLLMLPALLIACIRRLPGAKRFFLSSILLPLGLLPLITMLEPSIKLPIPPDVAALMPLFSMIASACIIVFSNTPKSLRGAIRKTKGSNAYTLEQSQETDQSASESIQLHMPAPQLTTTLKKQGASLPNTPGTSRAEHNENNLRIVFEKLFQTIAALEQHNLPTEALPHLQALTDIGRLVSNKIHTNILSDENQGTDLADSSNPQQEAFDLHTLFLTVHNAVSEQAEQKNLALAWFTAPHLLQQYEGPRALLEESLLALLKSAVRATQRGMVQIRAQRVPESTNPGHLLFTISDTGKGIPPIHRNAFALVKAWEMIASEGGNIQLESNSTGTTIAFSMRFKPLQDTQSIPEKLIYTQPKPLNIIIVSDVPSTRELLAYYLDELPHEIQEARSPDESFEHYKNYPGSMFILDGDMDMDNMNTSIANIRSFEGDHDFPLASIIALVSSYEQGNILRHAGCTHILLKPISRTELRHLILRVAPVIRSKKITPVKLPLPLDTTPPIISQIPDTNDTKSDNTSVPQDEVKSAPIINLHADDMLESPKPLRLASEANNELADDTKPNEELKILSDNDGTKKSKTLQINTEATSSPTKHADSNGKTKEADNAQANSENALKTLNEDEVLASLSALRLRVKKGKTLHETAKEAQNLPKTEKQRDVLQTSKQEELPSTIHTALQDAVPSIKVDTVTTAETDKPFSENFKTVPSDETALPKKQKPSKISDKKEAQQTTPVNEEKEEFTWLDSTMLKSIDKQNAKETKAQSQWQALEDNKTDTSKKVKKQKSLPLFDMLDFTLEDSTIQTLPASPTDSDTTLISDSSQPKIVPTTANEEAVSTPDTNDNVLDMAIAFAACDTAIKGMYTALNTEDLVKVQEIATHMAKITRQYALHPLTGHATCLADAARDKDTAALIALLHDVEEVLAKEKNK